MIRQKARSERRLLRLKEMSAAGKTKAEAADALGMSLAGVDSILYRNLHTTKWPIA